MEPKVQKQEFQSNKKNPKNDKNPDIKMLLH